MKTIKIIKVQAVRRHLEAYGSIDRLTAATRYKAFDLPDIVRKLRKKGMDIECLSDFNGNSKYQLTTHKKKRQK